MRRIVATCCSRLFRDILPPLPTLIFVAANAVCLRQDALGAMIGMSEKPLMSTVTSWFAWAPIRR